MACTIAKYACSPAFSFTGLDLKLWSYDDFTDYSATEARWFRLGGLSFLILSVYALVLNCDSAHEGTDRQ